MAFLDNLGPRVGACRGEDCCEDARPPLGRGPLNVVSFVAKASAYSTVSSASRAAAIRAKKKHRR